jgi:carbonic anhydrase
MILCGILSLSMNVADVKKMSSSQALELLMAGNTRFVNGKSTHLSYDKEAHDQMLEGQSPFAAILGCSDSRVPPEVIFDCGLGELFTVRDAGNVVGPIEMDSIEFAVGQLHVPLVMVLGHQNCGAVNAALKGSHVPELDTILPLINEGLKTCDSVGGTPLANAIDCNVKKSMQILRKSPTIAPLLAQKKVKIIGGYYNIDTGKVVLIY